MLKQSDASMAGLLFSVSLMSGDAFVSGADQRDVRPRFSGLPVRPDDEGQ
jgi:hypothetical protein